MHKPGYIRAIPTFTTFPLFKFTQIFLTRTFNDSIIQLLILITVIIGLANIFLVVDALLLILPITLLRVYLDVDLLGVVSHFYESGLFISLVLPRISITHFFNDDGVRESTGLLQWVHGSRHMGQLEVLVGQVALLLVVY